MTIHLVPKGCLLATRGSGQKALCFVLQGSVAISCGAQFASHKTLHKQGPCLAGEVDVLSEAGALLFIRAETQLCYLRFSPEALFGLTRSHPKLALRLLAALGKSAKNLAAELEHLHATHAFGTRRSGHAARRYRRRRPQPRARRLGFAKARGKII